VLLGFHLEPLIRAASTVRRAKPLGHDAFAPECTGVLVDHRAVAVTGLFFSASAVKILENAWPSLSFGHSAPMTLLVGT
jgi:hypothetical protein